MDSDVAIIGAGCIGASAAKHLAEAGHSVTVYEKEPQPALHQSGRNSGVIHPGYNAKPGTMKAKFCVDGSRQMRDFCMERGVRMVQGGILVVASDEQQLNELKRIHRQGKENDVKVKLVDPDEMHEIEPAAAGIQALHAPEGASVDARAYVQELVKDAEKSGAVFNWNMTVTDPDRLPAKVVLNAAGLHADRLAGNLCDDMRVVPFRGAYADVVGPGADLVRSHIYGAPHPDFPFLGVHLSRRADGSVTAGPGAMLSFGREAERLFHMERNLTGTLAWPGFWRLLKRKDFRRQVRQEIGKAVSTRSIWKDARRLVPELQRAHVKRADASRSGNRAQMIDRQGNLVDDIVIRETEQAVHVLNVVSPGLTCSMPFGKHLADLAAAKL